MISCNLFQGSYSIKWHLKRMFVYVLLEYREVQLLSFFFATC